MADDHGGVETVGRGRVERHAIIASWRQIVRRVSMRRASMRNEHAEGEHARPDCAEGEHAKTDCAEGEHAE